MIKVNNLYKEFYEPRALTDSIIWPFKNGRPKIVLNRINLNVEKNELFCVVGPNGAGKTTLIKILCNLITPNSGTAFVNGYDMTVENQKARESIGFVSGEERSFFWRLSGLDNLRFFAAFYNIPSSKISEEIDRVISIAGIDEPDKRFQEYSAGAKQRLSIARSLLREPEVLFMDEPTKSLDPLIASSFRKFIKEVLVVKHGKTVFFTTHQLNEAEDMADRLAIMDKGKVKACGTLKDLRENARLGQSTVEELFNYYIKQV